MRIVYICTLTGLATCEHQAQTDYDLNVCIYTGTPCTYRDQVAVQGS